MNQLHQLPCCAFCGNPEQVTLAEVWGNGEFQVETCCEALQEHLLELTPEEWADLLKRLSVEALTGYQLRQVLATEPSLLVDFKLEIHPVRLTEAKAIVRAHHAHNAPPVGWRFGASIWNGRQQLGSSWLGDWWLA